MKIVQFLLDYIEPSDSEQAKQYIIGIKIHHSKGLIILVFKKGTVLVED